MIYIFPGCERIQDHGRFGLDDAPGVSGCRVLSFAAPAAELLLEFQVVEGILVLLAVLAVAASTEEFLLGSPAVAAVLFTVVAPAAELLLLVLLLLVVVGPL